MLLPHLSHRQRAYAFALPNILSYLRLLFFPSQRPGWNDARRFFSVTA